jgi:hypothetical protein
VVKGYKGVGLKGVGVKGLGVKEVGEKGQYLNEGVDRVWTNAKVLTYKDSLTFL